MSTRGQVAAGTPLINALLGDRVWTGEVTWGAPARVADAAYGKTAATPPPPAALHAAVAAAFAQVGSSPPSRCAR